MNQNIVFKQILNFLPRHSFQKITRKYGNDHYVKSFDSWSQFSYLLLLQIKGLDSLRALKSVVTSRLGKWYHAGIKPFKKSTFADANKNRDHSAFKDLFYEFLTHCQRLAPKADFKIDRDLYSLDCTSIGLCKSLSEWAKFRTTKAGVRIHTLLNHGGFLPEFISLTEGNIHEIQVPTQKKFGFPKIPKGSILLMDRGYINYKWLYSLTNDLVTFITRAKTNMSYRIVERRSKQKSKGILADHIIELKGYYKSEEYPDKLRLIKYKDEETGNIYEFLTNEFKLCAKTIADAYKQRWQVELFFKWIKQNLKIKKFVGNSENAVFSQLWVGLIYYLMLAFMKFSNRLDQTLQELNWKLKELVLESMNLWDLFSPPEIKVKYLKNPLQMSFL